MGSCVAIDSTLGTYGNYGHNYGGSYGPSPHAANYMQPASPFSNMSHNIDSPMSPGTQGFMGGPQINFNIGGI